MYNFLSRQNSIITHLSAAVSSEQETGGLNRSSPFALGNGRQVFFLNGSGARQDNSINSKNLFDRDTQNATTIHYHS